VAIAMRGMSETPEPGADVTGPLRELERALAKSEARAAALDQALLAEIGRRSEDRDRMAMALKAAGVVGVWDGDMVAGVIYADATFAEIYGIDPAAAVAGQPSRHYYSMIHPDDLPAVAAGMEQAMRAADEFSSEHRIMRPDGTLRWVLARGRAVRDEAGKVVRFPGLSVDITARKQAEARHAFLLTLQDTLKDETEPRAILNLAAGILGRHLGASRIGYGEVMPDDETVIVRCGYADGMPEINGVFRLDDFGAHNATQARAGRTTILTDVLADPRQDRGSWERFGTRAHVSVPLIRNGRYSGSLYVSHARPHEWSADEVALIEDVAARIWEAAERAKAETRLRDSEGLFRTFAQAVPNHLWTAPPDGKLDWLNEQSVAYCGLPAQDILGDGWGQVVHPDDLPGVVEIWSRSLRTGELYETEFRLRRHDGAYRWHLVRAVPIRGGDGAIIRWVGTNTDIEEQKAAAQAIAGLNATLEAQVRERTAALMAAEAALRQSQKMEAVGQLTGGIAHDFNNMLQGIAGAVELMERRIAQGRPEEAARYVAAARQSIARAATLTHQLLAFSRKQALAPKRVDLGELIGGIAGLIRQTIGPAIGFEIRHAVDCWPVRCDPNQMENALLNLAINARDAMLPAGGTLTLETAHVPLSEAELAGWDGALPGWYVRITVTDTGSGMSPDVLEHAFEPFFTTKPAGQGTGLGLSQVYGFVRQSNGLLRLESDLGRGTAVHLYVPRHDEAAAEQGQGAEPPADAGLVQGANILLVEDEAPIRAFAGEALRDLGHTVLEASDGAGGLDALRDSRRRGAPPDLLIADIGLPGGMNGRQLAAAAREFDPALPVLLITGYAGDALGPDVQLEGGINLLTKPFTLQALTARVETMLLDRRR